MKNLLANSPHIAGLREEELRLLGKFDKKAQRILASEPTLSYGIAFARSVQQFPVAYSKYLEVRQALAQFGIRPLLPQSLSRG